MRSTKPFVINRDVLWSSDQRMILVDVSEYDGMLEKIGIKPLNRITAGDAIREWERDQDYMINSEYNISFRIEYLTPKTGGGPDIFIPVVMELEFKPDADITSDNLDALEDAIGIVLNDLDQPTTEVINLSIDGPTVRKMWYRISSQTVDFTPVCPRATPRAWP